MPEMGHLIIVEGPDGVGKTCVAAGLAERLRREHIDCDVFSFPGKDEKTLGGWVYNLHHNRSANGLPCPPETVLQMLHVAAHIDAIVNRIRPTLQEGRTVILDRYWWSTWVYGLTGGVAQESLTDMIRIEQRQWYPIKPLTVVLLTRESPFQDATADWPALCRAYRRLAEREEKNHRVDVIANTGKIDDTVATIIDAVRDATDRAVSHTSMQSQDQPALDTSPARESPNAFTRLAPAIPTCVFDTYWRFAAERQRIFFARLRGKHPPWTEDLILREHKFTNAYRASDRVSQYLIRQVIYAGDQSPEELFFRILLFKIFNSIDTWEYLISNLGEIRYAEYSYRRYNDLLKKRMSAGKTIYSPAYIMPSGGRGSRFRWKHSMHLTLLESMMNDEVPSQVSDADSMSSVFDLLRSYPTIGDFLAFQFSIDLNYSSLTGFDEMDFVVAGPGARDGITKCFTSTGGLPPHELIKVVADQQETAFHNLGIDFDTLWGRPLQLVDCQNLFCEVDKYARVRHPEFSGRTGRKRIKQRFNPKPEPIKYFYPPKWDINDFIPGEPSV